MINPEHANNLADILDKYAKRLREHPEIFDSADFSIDYPATPVYEEGSSFRKPTGFKRDHPLIFNLQLVLWPQKIPGNEP